MTYIFKQWMTAASREQQDALAAELGVSRAALYQISGGHRNVSAARAQEMAQAIAAVPGVPVDVRQTDLCEACGKCPHARAVLGDEVAGRGWQ